MTVDATAPDGCGSARSSCASAVQPVANETRDRIITGLRHARSRSSLLGFVAWQVWGSCAPLERPGGLRHPLRPDGLRHHGRLPPPTSPTAASRPARGARRSSPCFGSAAIEGPVISWVADHRKHHAFSDEEGDPHSPHVGHGGGLLGAAARALPRPRRLALHPHPARPQGALRAGPAEGPGRQLRRPDLPALGDRAGSAPPSCSAGLIGGTLAAGLTGLLWGGAVRMLRPAPRHLLASTRSATSSAGATSRPTTSRATSPGSRCRRFGEAWHNNHHAFPTSAVHGLGRWQLDPSAGVIGRWRRLGLAWDVVRIAPERQAAKAAA